MVNKRKHKRNTVSSQGYWQSYSDMMAALLLMFVLIMAFTLAQSLKTFEEQKAVMDEQQEQIYQMVGVKTQIIDALSKTFEETDMKIEIDEQTGAITLDSSILFPVASYNLSEEGKSFLREFMPVYLSVLLSEECRPYVAEIIIEGHTDTSGRYMYNLNLSQDRAYSVAKFILDENHNVVSPEILNELRNITTANGRSFSAPIYNEDGSVNAQKSRRVEIKFRLKDDEMIANMREILDGEGS